MTIEEAINHCEEKAEEKRQLIEKYKNCISNSEYESDCIKCAEEHEQLAEWLKHYRELIKPSGTYECFHCGHKSVIWDSDFDFSDYGLEGEGVIHVCHCANCGAEIEYQIANQKEEEEDNETSKRDAD